MNQKGFTLIEVIGIVIILVSIVLIITPNINNSLKNSKNKAFDVQIEEIKSATKSWVALNSENTPKNNNDEVLINILQLKLSGLLAYDFTNPLTGELFPDDMMIKITKKGLAYTYEVLIDTGTSVDGNVDLSGPQIILNGSIYLKIEVGTASSIPGATYKDENGNSINVTDIVYKKDDEVVSNIDYNNLGKYTVIYSASNNGKTNSIQRSVDIVDTTPPVIKIDGFTDNVCEDIEMSNYILPDMIVTDNYDNSINIEKKVFGNISSVPGIKKITYSATDSSGNTSSFILCINMKDSIKPVITNVDKTYNESLEKTIITVSASDTGTGLNQYAYSFDGGNTWQKDNYYLTDSSVTVVVRDKVGLISDSVLVNIYTFEDGEAVYYDVLNGKPCNNYHIDNSKTGYNGVTTTTDNQNSCLKFYAFNYEEGNSKVNLLLDHNTTADVVWVLNYYVEEEIMNVVEQLKIDTEEWIGTITPENYTVSSYTIDYSDYKARLITANEVAEITGNTSFDENTSDADDCFYFDTNSQTESSTHNYGWLYDRTSTWCTDYGCLNNSDSGTSGYWTSTSTDEFLWFINHIGSLEADWTMPTPNLRYLSTTYGIRPVIEVLKSNLN